MQRRAAGRLRAISENQSHKIGCRSAVGRVRRQSTLSRHPRRRIRRPEAAGQTKATHPEVVPDGSHTSAGDPQGDCCEEHGLRPSGLTSAAAHNASHRLAAPAGGRMAPRSNPGPIPAPSTGAEHAVPPGAAAHGPLHRPHRGQHGCRVAAVHQGRVRRLPRVRHPGARVPQAALRRMRPRQAAGLQLQAAWLLPFMRRAAHVADRDAARRPRHTACAGAALGVVAADPAALAAGRADGTGHASSADGAARGYAPPAGPRRAQG